MNKKIYSSKEIQDKILTGVDTICNPVKETLSPRGGNVLFETDRGDHVLTNDGITIAKNIEVADQIENSVIELIKEASMRTNNEAGDGTTQSILLTQVLVKEGLKLINEGASWIEVRNRFNEMGEGLVKKIEKTKMDVKTDEDLFNIANISSNNDKEIATNIVEVVKVAKQDGMVFIEDSINQETEILKDLGYMLNSGISHQELLKSDGKFTVTYDNVPVLITDKRIYHAEEAETILRVAVEAGFDSVVVVARDFMGESVNAFIANHKKGIINVLLVKDTHATDTDSTTLYDLSTYLGGDVVSEKIGTIVNKIKVGDFVMAKKVFADAHKTLITPLVSASKDLKSRIEWIQKEIKKDKKDTSLKRRLSSLTEGVVTIKVGGNTPTEIREKIYRYEDAVNATRSAMRDGYVVGGGLSLLNALSKDCTDTVEKQFCEATVRQIAENCGKYPDAVVEDINKNKSNTYGYNALTDKYEDLLKANVVDPYLVIKMAIENSISVTNMIISIKNYVINDLEDYAKKQSKKDED